MDAKASKPSKIESQNQWEKGVEKSGFLRKVYVSKDGTSAFRIVKSVRNGHLT